MTRLLALSLVFGGVALIALLELIRRQRNYYYGDANYTQQIQAWKSDTPLALPAIKVLKATSERIDRVARFKARSGGRPL